MDTSEPSLWNDARNASKIEGLDPLLKWPGGKRSLLKHLLTLVPLEYGTYYEAFVGGGALFFGLRPQHAVLSDSSWPLINCYIQVRDHPDAVIRYLRGLKNSEETYYSVRTHVPNDLASQAARLIYLVTLSFNGIYRENERGIFNVPYGHKLHLNPCDPVKIHAASNALSSAQLLNEDFEAAVQPASAGDLIYLDPPHTVAHSNNGFVKYNARVFSWADQRRLASVAHELSARGCTVLVSNADHPSIEALYRDFTVHRIQRASTIAASGEHRGHVTECIFQSQG